MSCKGNQSEFLQKNRLKNTKWHLGHARKSSTFTMIHSTFATSLTGRLLLLRSNSPMKYYFRANVPEVPEGAKKGCGRGGGSVKPTVKEFSLPMAIFQSSTYFWQPKAERETHQSTITSSRWTCSFFQALFPVFPSAKPLQNSLETRERNHQPPTNLKNTCIYNHTT